MHSKRTLKKNMYWIGCVSFKKLNNLYTFFVNIFTLKLLLSFDWYFFLSEYCFTMCLDLLVALVDLVSHKIMEKLLFLIISSDFSQ